MPDSWGTIITTNLPPQIAAAHELYLHYLISERRLAENSVEAYSADIVLFLTFLVSRRKRKLSGVDLTTIYDFLEQQ